MDAQTRRRIAGPGVVDEADELSLRDKKNLAKLVTAARAYEAEHAAEVADRRRAAEEEAAEHAAVLEAERAPATRAGSFVEAVRFF